MDHYYKDLSHLAPEERDRQNFDHPDAFEMPLLRSQIAALREGRSIERPTYDFATHTRTAETVRLTPPRLIVLDGILSLHDPDLRRMFDLKVFVDVDDDVRFIRRLRRDVVERGRTVDSVIGQYLASVKEMHDVYVAPQKLVADLIISWMTYNDRAVAMLSAWAAAAL
jgi:uridine kinase